jgi:hypothetical protein
MIIPNAAPAWGEPSNDPVRPLHKRTVTVVAMLALTATFIFGAAPAAIAAPASTNNHVPYAAGGPNNDCEGHRDSEQCESPQCEWPCTWFCHFCEASAHRGRGDRAS